MVEEALSPQIVKPPRQYKRAMLQLMIALVIFSSGIVVGTGGTMHWFKSRGWRPPYKGRDRRPPDPNKLVDDWMAKYGLSEEQGVQIRQILDDSRQARHTVFEAWRVEMEASGELMVEKIKALMTPEQFAQWFADYEKFKKRFGGPREGGRRRRGGRGRGPRDPNRGPPDRPPRINESKPATD